MITICCNVPGCQSTVTLSPADRDRVADALKERGWVSEKTNGDRKDYCPPHADRAKPVKPSEPDHEPVSQAD